MNDAIKTILAAAHYELKYAATVEQELGSLPGIEANEAQINQVLLTLVLRAARAMRLKEGKFFGVIRIRTSGDASQVVCEIGDNGRGLSAEETGRIFELFPEADEDDAAAGPGLGLAYDIVVNRHHGELLVESAPETGTKFVIRLPVSQSCRRRGITYLGKSGAVIRMIQVLNSYNSHKPGERRKKQGRPFGHPWHEKDPGSDRSGVGFLRGACSSP